MARVLIVEDAPGLVVVLRHVLSEHQVEVAPDGAEGFRLLAGPGRFDVVICDYGMPNMSGDELYDAVAVENPSMIPRFVFLTGSRGQPEADAFFARIRNPVLEKPCDVRDILGAVKAVLDAGLP